MVLQDGAAHKSLFCCKGDAGTRLCMLCKNLVTAKSGLVDEDGTDLLQCSLIHEKDMDWASDADIFGTVDRLAVRAGVEKPDVFKSWCTAAGFNHEPYGLLLNMRLRPYIQPTEQFCHDWMHCLAMRGQTPHTPPPPTTTHPIPPPAAALTIGYLLNTPLTPHNNHQHQ